MTLVVGDSTIRGIHVPRARVQSISGLLASQGIYKEDFYTSVVIAVGGNDLSNGCSPLQVSQWVEKTVHEVRE